MLLTWHFCPFLPKAPGDSTQSLQVYKQLKPRNWDPGRARGKCVRTLPPEGIKLELQHQFCWRSFQGIPALCPCISGLLSTWKMPPDESNLSKKVLDWLTQLMFRNRAHSRDPDRNSGIQTFSVAGPPNHRTRPHPQIPRHQCSDPMPPPVVFHRHLMCSERPPGPHIPHPLPWLQPAVPFFFFSTSLFFAVYPTTGETPWGQPQGCLFPLISCHCRDISLYHQIKHAAT